MKPKVLLFFVLVSAILSGCSWANNNAVGQKDKENLETAIATPEPTIEPTPQPTIEPTIGGTNNPTVTSEESSVDHNLCSENEDILFSFKIANSNKSASICISKNQQDYIIYRYGTEDKIELEYPVKTDDSWSLFTYSYYLRGGGPDNIGLDLNYLSFKNDGYTYVLYEEYDSESDIPLIGIKVTNQETNEETDIPGDSNSMNGTLISLRDNAKIKINAE